MKALLVIAALGLLGGLLWGLLVPHGWIHVLLAVGVVMALSMLVSVPLAMAMLVGQMLGRCVSERARPPLR